ncbi:MAG: glycosyltransferase family 4 protein [Candidatus Marinarcus sp.]|uniref:glycosyltransferase family 4 protein n=1 Tax=Candidatus Marinarcus sp. TaxID=3100987 RepID=UPI003AFF9B39
MNKMVIIVTVPVVLETWLKGQPRFLSQYYEVEIITSYAENIKNIEKYENVSIKVMDLNRKINLLKDLKVLIQLFIYLMKSRPTIVYTLSPKAGLLGMVASWISRIPYRIHNVVGLPHLEAQGKRKSILIFTETLTYWFSTNLYCNSFNLIGEMKKLTNKAVNVIGNGSVNGVDTQYFLDNVEQHERADIRHKNSIKDGDFVLTFVGRIVKDKGINELVNVFMRLSKKYENLKLLLIGDYEDELNPLSSKSRKYIETEKKIVHLEFQEDIRKYLSISDLFVLPSYREGLPNVLIEAGSYGIPLLATNINGCNEVIINGKNGSLVNKKDEDSLYKAIEKFLVDKEYYHFIKNNVRKSIIDRYSQEYFYNELYKEFLMIEKNQN